MSLRLGNTFWIQTRVTVPRHLWVVASKANDKGELVMLSLRSMSLMVPSWCGTTCVY